MQQYQKGVKEGTGQKPAVNMECENLDDVCYAVRQLDVLLMKFPNDDLLLSRKAEILRSIESPLQIGGATIVPVREAIACYAKILENADKKNVIIDKSNREFAHAERALENLLDLLVNSKQKQQILTLAHSWPHLVFAAPIEDIVCNTLLARANEFMETEPKEAEFYFDWLLEIKPNDKNAACSKIQAVAKYNVLRAFELCDKYLLERGSESWPWLAKSKLLQSIGRHEEGLQYLKDAHVRAKSQEERSALLNKIIDCAAAISKPQLALELATDEVTKAKIYYGMGHYKEAIRLAQRAAHVNPALAHCILGAANYELGDYKAASVAFQKLTEIAPENASTWYWHGQATLRANPADIKNLQSALHCLERAQKLGREIPPDEISNIAARIETLNRRRWLR